MVTDKPVSRAVGNCLTVLITDNYRGSSPCCTILTLYSTTSSKRQVTPVCISSGLRQQRKKTKPKAEFMGSMSLHTSFKTLPKKFWWFEVFSCLHFCFHIPVLKGLSLGAPPGAAHKGSSRVCVCVCVHTCISLLCVVPDDYPAWQSRCNNRVESTDNRVFLAQATSSSESIRIHLWQE